MENTNVENIETPVAIEVADGEETEVVVDENTEVFGTDEVEGESE